MLDDWLDEVFASVRDDITRILCEDGIKLHSYAWVIHSSIVFAFNLFTPTISISSEPLAGLLSEEAKSPTVQLNSDYHIMLLWLPSETNE